MNDRKSATSAPIEEKESKLPNSSQQELLDSFFSSEGTYFEVIKEYDGIDLGTKILYLERAIELDSRKLLASLDKLYSAPANDKNLDLIRAFKLINDLYFNNLVLYGEFGSKPALDHYFKRLGGIEVTVFQRVMKATIAARIKQLCAGNDKLIQQQKAARKIEEGNIPAQTDWREHLELPLALRILNLSHYAVEVGVLTSANIPITELQENNPILLGDLITYPYATKRLIEGAQISFSDLSNLNRDYLLTMLGLTNSFSVVELIQQAKISLHDLTSINIGKLKILLRGSDGVVNWVTETNISLQTLLALPSAELDKLLWWARSFIKLITRGDITWEQLTMLSAQELYTLKDLSSQSYLDQKKIFEIFPRLKQNFQQPQASPPASHELELQMPPEEEKALPNTTHEANSKKYYISIGCTLIAFTATAITSIIAFASHSFAATLGFGTALLAMQIIFPIIAILALFGTIVTVTLLLKSKKTLFAIVPSSQNQTSNPILTPPTASPAIRRTSTTPLEERKTSAPPPTLHH